MSISDDLLDKILSNGPSPGTQLIILSELKAEGKHKRVIQECIKALILHPDDISLRKLLSETYYEEGLLTQAESELNIIAAQINDLVSAYKLQAEIFINQGRESEALKALTIYSAHFSDDQNVFETIEKIKKDIEEESLGESQPEQEPSDLPEIVTPTLAEVYYEQGQVQETIEIYEKIIIDNPEDQTSINRLEELHSLHAPPSVDTNLINKTRERTEKLISILSSWLTNVQNMSSKPTTTM